MPRCRTYTVHEVMGTAVRVYDSLANFRLVCECLSDELLQDEERFQVLLALLYPDPQAVCDAMAERVATFLFETLWDAFGIDLKGTHESDPRRLLDWEEDHDRIVVTTRSAYGMGFGEFEQLPYKECCLLIGMAPHETPMGQAIYFRTAKPPKPTKYNRDQVKAFQEARRAYSLGRSRPRDTEESMQRANDAATATFRAIAAMAERRGEANG